MGQITQIKKIDSKNQRQSVRISVICVKKKEEKQCQGVETWVIAPKETEFILSTDEVNNELIYPHGFIIGQHAAEPTMVDKWHSTTLGFLTNN